MFFIRTCANKFFDRNQPVYIKMSWRFSTDPLMRIVRFTIRDYLFCTNIRHKHVYNKLHMSAVWRRIRTFCRLQCSDKHIRKPNIKITKKESIYNINTCIWITSEIRMYFDSKCILLKYIVNDSSSIKQ